MMREPIRLRLYVAGRNRRTDMAELALRSLLEASGEGNAELEVIDVLREPRVAESENILATPTLERLSPAPRRRLVGDLSQIAQVARELDLPTNGDASRHPGKDHA